MKRIKKQKPTAATAPADTHDDRVDVCRDCALKAYSRAQSELLGAIEGVNLIANDNKETREVCGAILLYLTAANREVQTLAEAAGVIRRVQQHRDGGSP